MKPIIVYSTVPNEFNANLIATTLVEENLAACVNILPGITSIYKWEGITQTDTELMLIIKTVEAKFLDLEKRIKELHENTLPELISIDISGGNKDYIDWISEKVNA